MNQPFAIPNDPRAQLVNSAIRQLVAVRTKLIRNLDVAKIKNSFNENDPEFIEAVKKEAFNAKYLKLLDAKILELELTT